VNGARLELFYPVLARLSCEDCQKYVPDYDWSEHTGTGKPRGPEGEPWKRPKESAPPCFKCPKRSPAEERQHVLSRKNWKTFQLALQAHATGGRCLTEEMSRDGLLMENVTVVCRLIEAHARNDLAERIAIKTYGIGRK
jgi:hypothetical protein